jgi:predicted RNase H-like HicB family nuclease
MAMVRTNINLDEHQYAALDAIRKSHGHSLSGLIRAAVDEYLSGVQEDYVQEKPGRLHFVPAAGEAGKVRVRIPVILTPDDEDGGFVVESPTMPGCVSQGDTVEEAVENVRDAIEGWVQVQREHGHPVYFEETDTYRRVEVTI